MFYILNVKQCKWPIKNDLSMTKSLQAPGIFCIIKLYDDTQNTLRDITAFLPYSKKKAKMMISYHP